jgi:hypothetical protein
MAEAEHEFQRRFEELRDPERTFFYEPVLLAGEPTQAIYEHLMVTPLDKDTATFAREGGWFGAWKRGAPHAVLLTDALLRRLEEVEGGERSPASDR